MFVVLDVDNTLADLSHRAHFIQDNPKNWEAYWSPDNVIKDAIVPGVERVIARFQELKYDFLILTGRPETLRDATMRWLLDKLNLILPDAYFLMRPTGNLLTTAEGKREQFLNFKQGLENQRDSFLFIDADIDTCTMLTPFGITFQAPKCWPLIFPETSTSP